MPSKKLTRTTYRDPTDPMNGLRPGDVARAEAAMDMDEYYRPLEQVHGSGLHEFGAAYGLRVNATSGAQGVRVLAGIAIDSAGRHISLAGDGQAEIGVQADGPGAAPMLVAVDPTNGALVPTAGLSGEKLVVIRHWETFDANAWNLYGAYVFLHTPWIRIVPAVGYVDNGNEVILAKVTLDGAGNVTSLVPGPRHGVGVPTETVHLRRGHQAAGSPSFGVDDAPYGEIRPRPTGDIQVTVPSASDWIELQRANGGSMAKLSVAAEQVDFRRNDGNATVRVKPDVANIELGANGMNGDILIHDDKSRLTIALDGHDAVGVFGHEGIDGEVRVKSRTGQNAFQAQGDGDVIFRGKLKDYNNTHPGVGHVELKDLTDGGTTSLHRHNIGVLGRFGATGTRLGITSGWVDLVNLAGINMRGSVAVNLQNATATPSGVGFLALHFRGYQGNYASAPHVIMSPREISLSTYTDTFFAFWYDISTTTVTFSWEIDAGAGSGYARQGFHFLLAGPI